MFTFFISHSQQKHFSWQLNVVEIIHGKIWFNHRAAGTCGQNIRLDKLELPW